MVLALGAALFVAGCAGGTKPGADAKPESHTVDPGAKKGDPFGYDGRKWRRGLGG